eukprot:10968400-Alexandrium_andersonii.AAC.1
MRQGVKSFAHVHLKGNHARFKFRGFLGHQAQTEQEFLGLSAANKAELASIDPTHGTLTQLAQAPLIGFFNGTYQGYRPVIFDQGWSINFGK